MKIFNLYSTKHIVFEDSALERYINLDEKLVLRTSGRKRDRFSQEDVNIIERIANLIAVSAHRGKKHKIQTGHASGKYSKNIKIVLDTLKIIEEKTKQNPIQVLIKAIENAAPRDEVTVIEYGGARYPQAVDISPLRRINITLRNIVHGAYDSAFNKKTKIPEALAQEILLASEKNMESSAMKKKNESEKQADSAR